MFQFKQIPLVEEAMPELNLQVQDAEPSFAEADLEALRALPPHVPHWTQTHFRTLDAFVHKYGVPITYIIDALDQHAADVYRAARRRHVRFRSLAPGKRRVSAQQIEAALQRLPKAPEAAKTQKPSKGPEIAPADVEALKALPSDVHTWEAAHFERFYTFARTYGVKLTVLRRAMEVNKSAFYARMQTLGIAPKPPKRGELRADMQRKAFLAITGRKPVRAKKRKAVAPRRQEAPKQQVLPLQPPAESSETHLTVIIKGEGVEIARIITSETDVAKTADLIKALL